MIVMVAGSRGWEDGEAIYQRLASLDPPPSLVLHGGARGADTHAERACKRLGIQTHVERPLYPVHGDRAPLVRTDVLLDMSPDLVLAFWDGASPGTGYTLRQAERRGIPCEVIYG